jgi:hypothetical protein
MLATSSIHRSVAIFRGFHVLYPVPGLSPVTFELIGIFIKPEL